jgi:AcrR family transcriptional regulator
MPNPARPARPKKGKTKKPVQARGERQKARLLVAARQTFQRLGYADTRVTDIARQAGVAHGTFYTYFDSREDALMAIAKDAFQSLVTPFDDDGNDTRSAPRLSIRSSIPAYIDAFKEVADVIAVVEQAGAMHPAVKSLHFGYRERLINTMEAAVTKGRVGGPGRRQSRSIAWAIYGALDSLLHAWLIDREDLNREDVFQTLSGLLAIWIPEPLAPAPAAARPVVSRMKGDGSA